MIPSALVKRLYDALSAMMYGWEDDGVRTEAFAALKEAEAFIDTGDEPPGHFFGDTFG